MKDPQLYAALLEHPAREPFSETQDRIKEDWDQMKHLNETLYHELSDELLGPILLVAMANGNALGNMVTTNERNLVKDLCRNLCNRYRDHSAKSPIARRVITELRNAALELI